MKKLDWNELAELGLLERINKEILHPLGLAAFRNVEDGSSGGALIADDGVWEFDPNMKSKIISDDEVRRKIHGDN